MSVRRAEPTGGGSRVALVTGSSGGIGYELARLLAEDGYGLVLVARSADLLERIAREFETDFGVSAWPVVEDLTDPEAPDRIFDLLNARHAEVDVLVNNAGFGTHGALAETDLGAELDMLQVNVVALTHLTKLFLGPMLQRGRGGILNVASTAAFQPGPGMAVYFATKAYVLSLTAALAREVARSPVLVTALCPGPTRTGFQKRAGMEASMLGRSAGLMDARSVARFGYRSLRKGRHVAIPGLANRLGARLAPLFPRRVVTRVVAHMTADPGS